MICEVLDSADIFKIYITKDVLYFSLSVLGEFWRTEVYKVISFIARGLFFICFLLFDLFKFYLRPIKSI